MTRHVSACTLEVINEFSAGLGCASVQGMILSYLQGKPHLYPLFMVLGFSCLAFLVPSLFFRRRMLKDKVKENGKES